MEYKDMNAIGIVRLMLTDGVITEEQAAKYFPELVESEDEKIRKTLINVFATHKDYEIFFGVSVKDILAWLEKQGKIVAYYEDRLDECSCKYFNKGYKYALENQGGPKEINID